MATPDIDVFKTIPGYKVILKTVLKNQIQQLVEQLASTTDEESMILTASLSDGSLSHLGSDFGKGFIDVHKDIKSQFLSFCLKKHYEIKQQENKSQEADTLEASIQDSHVTHVHMSERSPRSGPLLTSSSRSKKSMGIRFEPYPMTRSRVSAINLNPASEPGQSHVKKERDNQINKFKSIDNSDVPNLSERDKPFTATNKLTNDAKDNNNVDDNSAQQTNIDKENDEAYPLLSVKLEAVAKTIETFAEIDNELKCYDVEPMGTAIETEPEIMGDEHMGCVHESEITGVEHKGSVHETEITGVEHKTKPGIGVKSPIVMFPTPTDSNVLLDMKPYSFDDTGSQYDMTEKENNNAHLPHCDTSNSEPSFLSNIAVQTQASVHIDTKPVICNKCGKAFYKRNLSTVPSGNHTIVKPSQCETCSSECTFDGRQFNTRIVEKRETNGYKCEDCGKYFTHKSNLQRHLVVHTGIKPFTCDTCGKSFARKSYLSLHLATHLGLKPFKCDKCGKSFTQKNNLLSHLDCHSGIKPFKCDMCGKSFRRKHILTTHLALHSGLKPFKCDKCGKSFTQKSNLTTHLASHSRIKPFKCDKCGKSFKNKKYMISHLASHSGIKSFKCVKCGKSFSQKSNLTSHLARHSGGWSIQM